MSRIETLIEQLGFARRYTLELLETIPEGDWFRMPGGVTHIAWQVGHLAVAEYRLVLDRIFGLPPDPDVIPEAFLPPFARGSSPSADPAAYPTPAEIRRVFDGVHRRCLIQLGSLSDADLALEVRSGHLFVRTRGQALAWCAQHELVHAGQIALLRRWMGQPAVW